MADIRPLYTGFKREIEVLRLRLKFFKQSSDIEQSTVTVLVHAILRLFSSTFSCLMFKMPFLEEHLEGVGMRVDRKQRPKTQKQRGPPPKKKITYK